MATETITLNCTQCGREISVPAELESFSCVYCGAKLHRSDFAKPSPYADEADRAYAAEHLLDCIRDYPDSFKSFNRKKYVDFYQPYREDLRPVIEAMDRYICAQPGRRQALLEDFAAEFLRQWEDFHRNHPKAKSKMAREKQEFADKLTLACFAVPAIRDLGLSVSEDYPALLQERFNEKYPKNRFELASYEEIRGGFRKHGFCFVTTAVCEAEGKPDDCAELRTFRAFRDNWLARTEQGRALIREYYEIAPAIVAAMHYADNEPQVCADLRRDYLTPCLEALKNGKPRACRERYIEMVHSLRERYGL